MPKPSGPSWVPLFPDSKSIGDLKGSFAADVKKFLSALSKAGARVTVISTLRPPKQQYLMYWSFQIAKNSVDPTKARPMAGIGALTTIDARCGWSAVGPTATRAAMTAYCC